MTKKLKFTLITLLLAILSCLSLATVFAKYVTTQPIGDGYFDLNIEASVQNEAFAVYSDYDDSLNFYYGIAPTEGGDYNGKIATTVYKADSFLNASEQPQWKDYASVIKRVTVVDKGIQPTLTRNWFEGFTSCTSFELSELDTSKVTEMSYMFRGCTEVVDLDLSSFDTSRVVEDDMWSEGMYGMFENCTKLLTLDISNFNSQNISSFTGMFCNCRNLTTIYAGANFYWKDTSWGMGSWTEPVFDGCNNLEGGSGSKLAIDGVRNDSRSVCIDGLNGGKGLLTGIVHPIIYTTTLPGVKWSFSTVSGKTDFAPNTQSYIKLSGNVPSQVMITSSDTSVQSQILTVGSDGVLTIPDEFMVAKTAFTIKAAS